MDIMKLFMEMAVERIQKFGPEGGSPVLTQSEFLSAFGRYAPPSAEDFA